MCVHAKCGRVYHSVCLYVCAHVCGPISHILSTEFDPLMTRTYNHLYILLQFTGTSRDATMPTARLNLPDEIKTESVPSTIPPIRQWVIVVGANSSCNALASAFTDWMVILVDGSTARYRST